jgi:hypothetical protein
MKMISARKASCRRTRHSNTQSAFRNPKFAFEGRVPGQITAFAFRCAAGESKVTAANSGPHRFSIILQMPALFLLDLHAFGLVT